MWHKCMTSRAACDMADTGRLATPTTPPNVTSTPRPRLPLVLDMVRQKKTAKNVFQVAHVGGLPAVQAVYDANDARMIITAVDRPAGGRNDAVHNYILCNGCLGFWGKSDLEYVRARANEAENWGVKYDDTRTVCGDCGGQIFFTDRDPMTGDYTRCHMGTLVDELAIMWVYLGGTRKWNPHADNCDVSPPALQNGYAPTYMDWHGRISRGNSHSTGGDRRNPPSFLDVHGPSYP